MSVRKSQQQPEVPPPHDLGAERAVLGGLLHSPGSTFEVLRLVDAGSFYFPRHQAIMSGIAALSERGEAADVVILRDRLRSTGALDEAGGEDYLHGLADACPTTAHLIHHAKIVHRFSIARKALSDLRERERRIIESNGDLDGVLGDLANTAERFRLELCGNRGPPVKVRSFSEIDPKEVSWLWPNWIPRGMISLLDGDPGLGKSTLSIDIASRVTRGLGWPDGAMSADPGAVLLISAEDDPECTIRPRLDASGADVSKVFEIRVSRSGGQSCLPSFPENLPEIEDTIRRYGVVLLVADPLMALLGRGVDAHRDHDIRRTLAPVADLASRTGAAILLIRHLNKSFHAKAIYRGGGSIGIAGAARSALLVAEDPECETGRVLAPVKCNLAPRPASLKFECCALEGGTSARIEWTGASKLVADDLLAPADADHGPGEEARDFLLRILSGGPVLANQVRAEADQLGISKSTLGRAKRALGVESIRKGGIGSDGNWYWKLPTKDTTATTNLPIPHDEELSGTLVSLDGSTGEASPREAADG